MRTTVLLALGLLVLGCNRKPPPPGISLENYERVKEGMTMEEVRAILGPPLSSMYSQGEVVFQDARPGQSEPKPGRRCSWQWFTQHRHLESLSIVVLFDGEGRVVSKRESRSKIDPR